METKTASPIDEPLPADLVPYLEEFLTTWRPLLLRQATKHPPVPVHRRLWVDVFGKPMTESTLREIIKRRTKKEFGTALWPHLFRDCLLTSVAIDQPDLMRTSSVLLGAYQLQNRREALQSGPYAARRQALTLQPSPI